MKKRTDLTLFLALTKGDLVDNADEIAKEFAKKYSVFSFAVDKNDSENSSGIEYLISLMKMFILIYKIRMWQSVFCEVMENYFSRLNEDLLHLDKKYRNNFSSNFVNGCFSDEDRIWVRKVFEDEKILCNHYGNRAVNDYQKVIKEFAKFSKKAIRSLEEIC